MQRTPDSHPKNPLNLPEIRAHIARFLDRRDCLSCMRVSRDWFQDFAPHVWHTVDFAKDATAFSTMTPEVLDTYGGFITQAVNITSCKHLKSLQHSKVNSLRVIKVKQEHTCNYHQFISDTIRRSQATLRSIDIHTEPPIPDTLEQISINSLHYVYNMDAISPLSISELETRTGRAVGLTTLRFSHVSITRESFSSLLQRCSSLQELTLNQVLLSHNTPSVTLFSGSQLRCLICSTAQVWKLDPNDKSAPCLLAHFPSLKEWCVTTMDRSADIPSTLMSQDIIRYCPHLKNIRIDHGDSATASDLLADAFESLESCTLSRHLFDASTILGLIAHQESLTSVSITDNGVMIQDWSSINRLYMIPRLCRSLQVLSMESIACEIGRVESHKWACKDLRELRVRFKGLDTPNEIDGCLKQLCGMRRSGGTSLAQPMGTDTTVTRIAQHLFQFKQLRTVWLGSRDYYLLPSPV